MAAFPKWSAQHSRLLGKGFGLRRGSESKLGEEPFWSADITELRLPATYMTTSEISHIHYTLTFKNFKNVLHGLGMGLIISKSDALMTNSRTLTKHELHLIPKGPEAVLNQSFPDFSIKMKFIEGRWQQAPQNKWIK